MVTQKQRVVTQKNGTIEQTNNQNKTTRSVGKLDIGDSCSCIDGV